MVAADNHDRDAVAGRNDDVAAVVVRSHDAVVARGDDAAAGRNDDAAPNLFCRAVHFPFRGREYIYL